MKIYKKMLIRITSWHLNYKYDQAIQKVVIYANIFEEDPKTYIFAEEEFNVPQTLEIVTENLGGKMKNN